MKNLKDILTKKYLETEYVKNKKNSYTIAKEVGCNPTTVLNYLKKYNISSRPMYGTRLDHNLKLTPLQSDILTGSILGDGSLHIGKKEINACYREQHCLGQKIYLEWIEKQLFQFIIYNHMFFIYSLFSLCRLCEVLNLNTNR